LPDLAVTLAGAALPLLVNELVKAGTPTPSAGSSS
jgi:hypothetical protein